MATKPAPPASPKNYKVKAPQPGTPMYGCEHLQRLFNQDQATTNTSIQHYKSILRTIFDASPVLSQTAKGIDGQAITTLTPTYLCLQCPLTLTEEDRTKHGAKKSHRFYVESRSGALYCQMCDDIVWDPTFEELRIRKMGTGTFSASRKRKHEEMFASSDPIRDNPSYITMNTTMSSCKANGLRGIYNAGATCYQNVILQCFLHNPILRNYYLSDGHPSSSCDVPHCLSCAMDDIFQSFYADESTNGYTAANILSGFWISEKKAFENLVTTKEQDAHEFFQFLAEELHERNGDGKRPEMGSEHTCNCIIHQTYYGKLQTTTTCQNCQGVTSQVQSFLDLSLPLENLAQRKKKGTAKPGPLTLQECLEEEYIKQDKCEYRCNNCGSMQQAKRQTSIRRLPNVLSIQLKRFEYKQGRNERAAKIDTPVQFPLQLNMLPYTSRARNHDVSQNYELQRSCTYDLLSVVVHVGEIDTGHYVSYCRVGDQWFVFNDHKVELAQKSDVLNSKAYLLFYCVRSLS
ncbi:ubiquitin carboxyl-terminal hydrolase-like protein [Thermochaetoides thermophila DSM 1495]|uniref:Ubiquitin carboxyl-terminal hydrolase-like protein n=1 Tax=Chaetomium thermophilum (strain DSM 1495 / CBS 144.50 / IMI 039719) TaxID=759272 RepID=G0SB37_CHATD|nr:ubiquitin carboxyl-terminal hydrolase-like protein [Thermochaetoides thermophila DSM 1495]EGS19417.1 ubiquitin carboxyl-terminal hydrolase-like protein [Thermochaetoides thermophila DSM 1495]